MSLVSTPPDGYCLWHSLTLGLLCQKGLYYNGITNTKLYTELVAIIITMCFKELAKLFPVEELMPLYAERVPGLP